MITETQTASSDLQAIIVMLQEELAATNREVMLLTLELEDRVADRTAQLAKANQELISEARERVHAEAEIQQLNGDLANRAKLLEEANRELEAFSYSVSHDLRAPLTHMIGFATILQDETAATLSEKPQGHLEKIIAAGRRMATLIDDLLRFSRLSHVDLVFERVELTELFNAAVCELKQYAGARKITWMLAPLPAVRGDRALLRQVAVNLISNAIKYTRHCDRAEIAVCAAAEPGREVVISIRDNGAGFDPRYAQKLFGVFQRLHGDKEFEGTGVGLANVRRIINRHGGRVWAEGTPGVGATFYFSLPAKPEGA